MNRSVVALIGSAAVMTAGMWFVLAAGGPADGGASSISLGKQNNPEGETASRDVEFKPSIDEGSRATMLSEGAGNEAASELVGGVKPWRPSLEEVKEMLPSYMQVRPEQREMEMANKYGPLLSIDDLEGAQEILHMNIDEVSLALMVDAAVVYDEELEQVGKLYFDELDFVTREIYAQGNYRIESNGQERLIPGSHLGERSVVFPEHIIYFTLNDISHPQLKDIRLTGEDVRRRRMEAMRQAHRNR